MKSNKTAFLFFILFSLFPFISNGQTDGIPDAPKPAKLVNDFAGFLSSEEQNYLEQKLVSFDDSTSTQITIVTVKSLNGYEPNDFATRLGQKWGVGRKGKDNGIVILVKPKTADEKGQVYIATGYGMESFVTDALSKRIIEQEILPAFRMGNNFQGLNKATDVLISLAKGQFTADQYIAKKQKKKNSNFPLPALIIIGILIVVFVMKGRGSQGSGHVSGSSNLPLWLLLGSMLSSGRSSSGGFGDFSSGSGGFGGFGGGSFGGGGAGGSW